jgi:hypothetical protein
MMYMVQFYFSKFGNRKDLSTTLMSLFKLEILEKACDIHRSAIVIASSTRAHLASMLDTLLCSGKIFPSLVSIVQIAKYTLKALCSLMANCLVMLAAVGLP